MLLSSLRAVSMILNNLLTGIMDLEKGIVRKKNRLTRDIAINKYIVTRPCKLHFIRIKRKQKLQNCA